MGFPVCSGAKTGKSEQIWAKTEENSIIPTKKWEKHCFLP
jgi:hypothetical protein